MNVLTYQLSHLLSYHPYNKSSECLRCFSSVLSKSFLSTPNSILQKNSCIQSFSTVNTKQKSFQECVLYKTLSDEDKSVQCTSCNKRCIIKNHQSGFCQVRVNQDGKLFSTVYNYPSALQIDPIEKKPLYHFLPGSSVLSIGTVGCNYRCSFCQNYHLSQTFTPSSNTFLSPQQLVQLALLNHCQAIAFTYNEPTIWGEYACDIAKEAKQNGLATIYVTNGSMTEEHLQYIHPYIDAMNIDLKSWREMFYRKICQGDLETVKRTIEKAWKMGFWIELTTLLIPQENDDHKDLEELSQFIASISTSIPWHISAFHPDYKMMDKQSTSLDLLQQAYTIGKENRLDYIYLGNVDSSFSNTRCPNCNYMLIQRKWNRIIENNCLGVCPKCGQSISGKWKKE